MIYRKALAAGTGAASRKVLINDINCIDYADYNDNFIDDADDNVMMMMIIMIMMMILIMIL